MADTEAKHSTREDATAFRRRLLVRLAAPAVLMLYLSRLTSRHKQSKNCVSLTSGHNSKDGRREAPLTSFPFTCHCMWGWGYQPVAWHSNSVWAPLKASLSSPKIFTLPSSANTRGHAQTRHTQVCERVQLGETRTGARARIYVLKLDSYTVNQTLVQICGPPCDGIFGVQITDLLTGDWLCQRLHLFKGCVSTF